MAGQRSNYGKRSHSDYSDNGGQSKRRNPGEERDYYLPGPEDTVYRYLCPGRKIGSVIGRGGEIVKQLRQESQSKIRIGETVPGCEERVITIFSSSKETNTCEGSDEYVCPAQDALFRIHERLIADDTPSEDDSDTDTHEVTARLLVPSDQIGCIIGKGGQIIQNIRSETGAQIRILKNDHIPSCAMRSDELLQIVGEPSSVKKALLQIASRLHDNPSRSQHMLASAMSNTYQPGSQLLGVNGGGSLMGVTTVVGPYGGYKSDTAGEWPSHSYFTSRGEDSSSKEFSLRLVCPTANIGGVIGKGGGIIKQIRQESGATIKVDSSLTAGDDCLITISAMEYFEDPVSPSIDAVVRLQLRCSEKIERESGEPSYTTRLLVPSSCIGCLIGKGGSIINEMRRLTRANIRIFSKENLPKVALEGDEMVQISGDSDSGKNALVQVTTRLRANFFDREGALSLPPYHSAIQYVPEISDGLTHGSLEGKSHGHGFSSYSGKFGGSGDLPPDNYGLYVGSQSTGGPGYGAYSGYSGRSSTTGFSGRESVSRSKNHGY